MGLIEAFQESMFGHILTTFFVAMLPVLELRGAIPLGVSMGLNPWAAMFISILGNIVPAPFIIIFIRRIFAWLRKKSPRMERLVSKLEHRAHGKRELIHKYSKLGLTILVAIPLPGTGAWTGSLVAALMRMRIKDALPAIFIGVVIAGFLITGLSIGFTALF